MGDVCSGCNKKRAVILDLCEECYRETCCAEPWLIDNPWEVKGDKPPTNPVGFVDEH